MGLVSLVVRLNEISTLYSKCWTVQHILNTTFPFMLYWRQNSLSLSSFSEEYAYSCIIRVFCYLCLDWFLFLLLLLGDEVQLPVYYIFVCMYIKGKEVPLQAWSGPESSRTLRFLDFMTSQNGGKVVSLTHRPPLPPGNTPGTHLC